MKEDSTSTMIFSDTRVKPEGGAKVGLSLKQIGEGPIFISKINTNSLFASSEDIKAGQMLVSINDILVNGMSTNEAVQILKKIPSNHRITLVTTAPPATQEEDTDALYDDACQLGQFLLNPCWFLYLQARRVLATRHQKNTTANKISTEEQIKNHQREKILWTSSLQQGIYLLCFWGCWIAAFAIVYPIGLDHEHFPKWVESFGRIVFTLCVFSWGIAKFTSPGCITMYTMDKYDNYKYDGILYKQSNICPTLGIRKLARSKYDRYSCTHVPRFDHFCGWLGNTIGEENYRFFLTFLAVHVIMFLYAIPVLIMWMWKEGQMTRVQTAQPVFQAGLENFLEHAVQTIIVDKRVTLVCIVCFCTIIPLAALLGFHLSLVGRGMTTNEFYKWKRLSENQSNMTSATLIKDIEEHGLKTMYNNNRLPPPSMGSSSSSA